MRHPFSRRAFGYTLLSSAAPMVSAAARPDRFGFGTYGMKSLSILQALTVIAQIGYRGVQLCLMPGWPSDSASIDRNTERLIRRLLDDQGLTLFAVQDNLPANGTPQRSAANLARVRRAAEIAANLQAQPVLDTVLGFTSGDWERVKQQLVDEVGSWAAAVKGSPLTIGIKPHVNHALDTPRRTLWLLRQINAPNVRVVYDYSHMQLAGLPLEGSLRELLPYTGVVSIKDAKGTPEHYEFLLPGEGATGYASYFSHSSGLAIAALSELKSVA